LSGVGYTNYTSKLSKKHHQVAARFSLRLLSYLMSLFLRNGSPLSSKAAISIHVSFCAKACLVLP
jgi:hypothetical protein